MPSAEAEATAVDSSVIVAALLGWHRDHGVARRLLDAALESGKLLVPSRVLTESYSVLTRIPPPHRLAPRAAMELLTGTLAGATTIVDLPTGELVDEAAQLRTRLDTATALEETTRTYVERLESMVDEQRLPSGDDLIGEIERFLREGGTEGRPN